MNQTQIHNINTRSSSHLHIQTANLTTFQKGPFYFGIKVFNYLPTSIKNTPHDIRQFKSVLKSFLLINSFYSLEEYFTWNLKRDMVQCNNFKSKHLNNLSCNVTQYNFILLFSHKFSAFGYIY